MGFSQRCVVGTDDLRLGNKQLSYGWVAVPESQGHDTLVDIRSMAPCGPDAP